MSNKQKTWKCLGALAWMALGAAIAALGFYFPPGA